MTKVIKTISLTEGQAHWLKEHKIKLSKLVQRTINKLIEQEFMEKSARL
jgi:hypothetical protein